MKFPQLERYTFDSGDDVVSCWPVDDLLKAHLKNSASRWRCEQKDKVVKKVVDKIERSVRERSARRKGKK